MITTEEKTTYIRPGLPGVRVRRAGPVVPPSGGDLDLTHERLAVVLPVTTTDASRDGRYCGASIDIVDPSGALLFRLNVSANDRGWADADVIVDPATTVGTFLAWRDGREVVRERLEGNAVFAVDMRRREG